MLIALPFDPPVVRADAAVLAVDPVVVPATAHARRLLLRVTAPVGGRNLPVVLLSHGDHLSRADYRPLVDWWARAGFVVVQPDHADASTDGTAAGPAAASRPADAWRVRVTDMERVIDALPWIATQVPGLAGRIDPHRIAIAGHSLGGFTAELLAGARRRTGDALEKTDRADPRIRAVILLAPPGRAEDLTPEWRLRAPYLDIDVSTMHGPLLVVAGGADRGPMTTRDESWRQDAYRLAPAGRACLVVVAGAGHYLGGVNGTSTKPDGDATPARLALVRDATTRFLRAALVGPDRDFATYLASLGSRAEIARAACK